MKKVGKITEEGVIQQSTIYLHPLQHKKLRLIMEKHTLENSCILVATVGSVFHRRPTSVTICIFIRLSTCAQNVANVVKAAVIWRYTCVVIQERNHLNVHFVANDLQGQMYLLCTAEFTVETNNTNVTCVTRRLVCLDI